MLLYVETTSGSVFSIRMNPWDTVLDTKKMIEKSQGIAVSSQELYFKGMRLVLDDMSLFVCNIVNNSRLLLVLPDEYNYQVLPRTEQAPAPSNYITNIKDSLGKNQGLPAMVTYDQMLRQAMPSLVPSNATEGFVNQRWPAVAGSNNDQMLHQTVQSPVPQAFFNQGSPAMARSNNDQMLQQTVPQAFFNQGLPTTARSNNDQMLQQTEQSLVPSNVLHPTAQSPIPQALFDQGSPAMARSNDDQELHQTVESPLNSYSIDELLQLVPETPVTAEDISKMQSWTVEGNANIQESPRRNDNNQELLQRESSHPSNTFGVGDFSFGEDRPLSTEDFTNSQSYRPASTTEETINKDQVIQTEKSTVPSNTFGNFLFGEDRPLSTEHFTNIQSYLPASTTEEIFNKNQVFQTEQATVPSNTSGNLSFREERPLSIEDYTNIQSYTPASTTEAIINENQVLQTGQTSVPSHSTEQRINTQDLPVRVGSSDQREKSPPIREVINIPDSPVKVGGFKKPPQKLRVMVLPYSSDNKPVSKFPVNVTASDKVEELKKELEKIQQRSPLGLPQEGYFFIHKQRVLDDDQSFRWNGVAHGDTIEIFPGYYTNDGDRTKGVERYYSQK